MRFGDRMGGRNIILGLITATFWEAQVRAQNKERMSPGGFGTALWASMGTFKEGTKQLKPNSHSQVAPLEEGLADTRAKRRTRTLSTIFQHGGVFVQETHTVAVRGALHGLCFKLTWVPVK